MDRGVFCQFHFGFSGPLPGKNLGFFPSDRHPRSKAPLSPAPIPPERIEVDGYTYVSLRETAKNYGYTLKQTISPYQETLESGTLVGGQSVTCYLSEKSTGPMGDTWFVWQDGQVTSYMCGGCMFGVSETSYPTPFYLEGRRVYIAEDLVDAIFSPDAAPGPSYGAAE